MSIESRLKRLEKHYLKSVSYYRGMEIMKEINKLQDGDPGVVDLLVKLYANGNPKKQFHYPI